MAKVLAALADLGEATAAAIAEKAAIGYSTTPKLRTLEEAALAERFRGEDVRTLWRLTAAGRTAAENSARRSRSQPRRVRRTACRRPRHAGHRRRSVTSEPVAPVASPDDGESDAGEATPADGSDTTGHGASQDGSTDEDERGTQLAPAVADDTPTASSADETSGVADATAGPTPQPPSDVDPEQQCRQERPVARGEPHLRGAQLALQHHGAIPNRYPGSHQGR